MALSDRFPRTPPRPPRPPLKVSEILNAQFMRRLAVVCGEMGCSAIVATAYWDDGRQQMLADGAAGACEADVVRLKRHLKDKERNRP